MISARCISRPNSFDSPPLRPVIRPCSDGNSGALPTPTGSDARKPRSSPAIGLHQRLVGPSRRDGQRARRHSRQVLVPLTFLLKSRSLRHLRPAQMVGFAQQNGAKHRRRDENEVRRSAAEMGRVQRECRAPAEGCQSPPSPPVFFPNWKEYCPPESRDCGTKAGHALCDNLHLCCLFHPF